jgi:hypothetical protein
MSNARGGAAAAAFYPPATGRTILRSILQQNTRSYELQIKYKGGKSERLTLLKRGYQKLGVRMGQVDLNFQLSCLKYVGARLFPVFSARLFQSFFLSATHS